VNTGRQKERLQERALEAKMKLIFELCQGIVGLAVVIRFGQLVRMNWVRRKYVPTCSIKVEVTLASTPQNSFVARISKGCWRCPMPRIISSNGKYEKTNHVGFRQLSYGNSSEEAITSPSECILGKYSSPKINQIYGV
jgi:hypothetical protein